MGRQLRVTLSRCEMLIGGFNERMISLEERVSNLEQKD